MSETFEIASDGEVEVCVNLVERTSPVVWRQAGSGEDRWDSTPYQSADVRDVHDALRKVTLWLDTSYGI